MPGRKQLDDCKFPANTYSFPLRLVGDGVPTPRQEAVRSQETFGENVQGCGLRQRPPCKRGLACEERARLGDCAGDSGITTRLQRIRTAVIPHPPRPHKLHIACFRLRPKSALIPLLVLSPPKPLTLGFGVAPYLGGPLPPGEG